MAHSKFEYVRRFEQDDSLLLGTYIVVRIDGRGFSRFTSDHNYKKPNDVRGLSLMNQCAAAVMRDWGDVVLAFGESDEYSFVFPRRCSLFGRRASKLATGIVSLFSSSFVYYWNDFFPGVKLLRPPSFDGRCIAYPDLRTVCDYFKWRQVDTHINTLYNEAFWALVQLGGKTPTEAADGLKFTVSSQKHELLHGTFGINYAKLPVMYRRGTTLFRLGSWASASADRGEKKAASSGSKRKQEIASSAGPAEAKEHGKDINMVVVKGGERASSPVREEAEKVASNTENSNSTAVSNSSTASMQASSSSLSSPPSSLSSSSSSSSSPFSKRAAELMRDYYEPSLVSVDGESMPSSKDASTSSDSVCISSSKSSIEAPSAPLLAAPTLASSNANSSFAGAASAVEKSIDVPSNTFLFHPDYNDPSHAGGEAGRGFLERLFSAIEETENS